MSTLVAEQGMGTFFGQFLGQLARFRAPYPIICL